MRTDVTEPVVAFEDVEATLGGTAVLHGVTFGVERGETVVLLGRSGSGKSTTLRLINRLLLPSAGAVRVDGRSTTEWDPIELRHGIGYVLQDIGLFPHFPVARNVGLVPALLGWSGADIRARTDELLELVGLERDLRDRYPAELSGGQRQRVGIARALAARPELMLCDEPFGALDPITRYELQTEFRSLSDRLGTTIVFVTHDVREARLLADRIAFLDEGRLAFVGTPDAFDRADDPRVARFREAAA